MAQAKLWVSHYIFNCSNYVYNSNFIVFLSANILHCMNNIGPSYFTVAPMWPKSYHITGPKRHLVSHRTLSKTLIFTNKILKIITKFASPKNLYNYCIIIRFHKTSFVQLMCNEIFHIINVNDCSIRVSQLENFVAQNFYVFSYENSKKIW